MFAWGYQPFSEHGSVVHWITLSPLRKKISNQNSVLNVYSHKEKKQHRNKYPIIEYKSCTSVWDNSMLMYSSFSIWRSKAKQRLQVWITRTKKIWQNLEELCGDDLQGRLYYKCFPVAAAVNKINIRAVTIISLIPVILLIASYKASWQFCSYRGQDILCRASSFTSVFYRERTRKT